MKFPQKLNLLFIFFIIAFIALSCSSSKKTGKFLVTSSPNKTYTVELIGNALNPEESIGYTYETQFNLIGKEKVLVKNELIQILDDWDGDFSIGELQHNWENDKILRFGEDITNSKYRPDLLTISNNTDKTIKYLKIKTRDFLFVFGIKPKSNMSLSVPHQNWHSYIWSAGEFTDGQFIDGSGTNFHHQDKIKERLRYSLIIDNDGIKIASPMMDGDNSKR